MSYPVVFLIFSTLGGLISQLVLNKDRAATFLGIAMGLCIGGTIYESPWFAPAVLIFAALLYWRRHHVRHQLKATA